MILDSQNVTIFRFRFTSMATKVQNNQTNLIRSHLPMINMLTRTSQSSLDMVNEKLRLSNREFHSLDTFHVPLLITSTQYSRKWVSYYPLGHVGNDDVIIDVRRPTGTTSYSIVLNNRVLSQLL